MEKEEPRQWDSIVCAHPGCRHAGKGGAELAERKEALVKMELLTFFEHETSLTSLSVCHYVLEGHPGS